MVELKKICESRLTFEIISFFHENPQTLDTARSIAAWLNHERRQIKEALDFLVKENILIAHRTGGTTAYAYTQEKEIIKRIGKFLEERI